ncbi:hypothetical protein [Denitrobacterium detoxificans]|jgi:hypothetical protein|uniref:hypothetical protein n=1 Tax=Denitrobacterium detoxificans TaxID=79604 RepID=UPI0026EB0B93|nr:hypothetical protein [Denitrobacterium detoxificans]MBE6466725.1 hypothetical protein [Denitrobacterium detoxificans]
MLTNVEMFDALYALMTNDVRSEALLGASVGKDVHACPASAGASLAREAILRAPNTQQMPVLWFEIPLLGEARFDLHMAYSHWALRDLKAEEIDLRSPYGELFRWYANEEPGGNGLALAFDISRGRLNDPAVHVNINGSPLRDIKRFFDIAAGEDAYDLYREFSDSLPAGWKIWYTGVHPGRPGAHLRVDCFADRKTAARYEEDCSLLVDDLCACGFYTAGSLLQDCVRPILESPFGLELQFDLMRDGSVGSTIGLSAAFPFGSAAHVRELFEEGGDAAAYMHTLEDMGLADDRWRCVLPATFSKVVPQGEGQLALYCVPTFVKLRMRNGDPFDAKLYMQTGAAEL